MGRLSKGEKIMKYICILDTETIVEGQKTFDVGIIIATTQGDIVLEKQWFIKENFFKKFFYEEKRDLYISRLHNPDYPSTLVTAKEFFTEYDNILKFFKVDEVYAYNASFDTRVIRKLAEQTGNSNPLEDKNIECLWLWSTQTLMLQKNFKKFAKRWNLLTPKGNYKTSAEIAYAYLINDPDFVEEHTALEDCKIELEIYKACKKQKKARIKGVAANPWLIPQEKEQIEKLPPQFRTMKINLECQIEQAEKLLRVLNENVQVELNVKLLEEE